MSPRKMDSRREKRTTGAVIEAVRALSHKGFSVFATMIRSVWRVSALLRLGMQSTMGGHALDTGGGDGHRQGVAVGRGRQGGYF